MERVGLWMAAWIVMVGCSKGFEDEIAPAKPARVADRCVGTDGCKERGNCKTTSTTTTTVSEYGSKGVDVDRSTSFSCVPDTKADCEQSTICTSEGACSVIENTALGRRCGAASDDDCRRSDECKIKGRCTTDKEFGHCQGVNDADCAASTECKQKGHCVARVELTQKSRGLCGPRTAADCKNAPNCAQKGTCTMKKNGRGNEQCVAGSDADCAASAICKTEGACRQWSNGDHCTK